MAVYKANTVFSKNAKPLTNSQIKAEIMDIFRNNPALAQQYLKSPLTADKTINNKLYKRAYDIYALRFNNYKALIGVEKSVPANEYFLRTLRRQAAGVELTDTQSQILQTSSQNRLKFKKSVEAHTVSRVQTNIAINGILKTFKEFIDQTTRVDVKSGLHDLLFKKIYVDDNTGELIPAEYLYQYKEADANIIEKEVPNDDLTPEELYKYLKNKAADLHEIQKSLIKSSGGTRRSVGS